MKIFIVALSLFSFNAFATKGFYCIPSIRDTRMQVLVLDKGVEVLVTSPMGYNFMPQFDGQGSSFQISFNNMQAKDLFDLGNQFSFSWPKEKCKVDVKNFKVTCQGEAQKLVKSIQGLGITTTEITEKYEEVTYNKRKFRWSVFKDNTYFVTQEYDISRCGVFN